MFVLDLPDWMVYAVGLAAFILYAVFDALADAYIFKWMRQGIGHAQYLDRVAAEENRDYNRSWHRMQAAQQALFILAVCLLSGQPSFILLGSALFWILHDGIVNKVGLERPFFYVGETAWTDRQFQRFENPEQAMAFAKWAALIAGIIWFILSLLNT